MTIRNFQVPRRRSNLVDIITPKRAGVKGYRFRAAPTFSGTFATILTADISSGFLDPAVDRRVLTPLPNGQNHVRIVFDPDTFTGAAAIVDTDQFWLTFTPVDFSGVPGTESAPGLILPETERIGGHRITIQGNAPNEASLADSLQLDLPGKMQDFRIANNEASGGNSLFVATSRAGGEEEILPLADALNPRDWSEGATDTLYVRGGGGSINMTANFANYLPL